MNYLDEFRKFISSHYLSTGIRLTLGAVIPCLIFHHYGILSDLIAFPLGTLLIGTTDNPGPLHRRRNSLMIAIVTCFVVACVTGYLRHIHFLAFFEIIIFGMFFSLVGVYGNRANSIGLIALLVFVFNIDNHMSGDTGNDKTGDDRDHQRVILRENHETLREILFKTRQIVTESTNTSRILMLMFLDSVDLMERILNSQQNYSNLHRADCTPGFCF